MACPDQNELGIFAEGGLSAEKRADIQSHIDGCSDCFTLVVELARMGASSAPQDSESLDFSSDDTLGSVDGHIMAAMQNKNRVRAPVDCLGQVIDGRYRVDRLIGKGGFAEVYKAHQLSVGRDVAIKVLTTDLTSQDEIVRRFEAEARIVSRLKHPNTLKLYDFGRTDNGRLYIVIELLNGQPVDQVLRNGPIEQTRLAVWLKQVCGAIQEAHDEGIFHRDLKPSNLYLETVTGEDFIKVLDFGIAKVADTKQTTSGIIMGTPSYMSPEQVEARHLDHRTDLYSLGVISYEALTGQAPFVGDTPVSVMYKHAKQKAPDVRLIREETHPAIANLISALLEKEPANRPATAMSVIDYLDSINWATSDIPMLQPRSTAPHMGPFTHSNPQATPTPAPTSDAMSRANLSPKRSSIPQNVDHHQRSLPPTGTSEVQSGSWIGPPPRRGLPLGWVAFGILAAAVGGFLLAQQKGQSQDQKPTVNAAKTAVSTTIKDARRQPNLTDTKAAQGVRSDDRESKPTRSALIRPSQQQPINTSKNDGPRQPKPIGTRDKPSSLVIKQKQSEEASKSAPEVKKSKPRPVVAAKSERSTSIPKPQKRRRKKAENNKIVGPINAQLSLSPKRATYALTDTPQARLRLTRPDGSQVKQASIKWTVKPAGRARIDPGGRIQFVSEGPGTITGCSGRNCKTVRFYAEADE